MEDENKLSELKTLYDELWLDAKTMLKDMRRSISLYLYSGFVTLLVSIFAIISAANFFSISFSGTGNLAFWFYAVVETVAAVGTVAFGARLLYWYRKLKMRYSKLTQMEKTIR